MVSRSQRYQELTAQFYASVNDSPDPEDVTDVDADWFRQNLSPDDRRTWDAQGRD
jgi:hypothetical protein